MYSLGPSATTMIFSFSYRCPSGDDHRRDGRARRVRSFDQQFFSELFELYASTVNIAFCVLPHPSNFKQSVSVQDLLQSCQGRRFYFKQSMDDAFQFLAADRVYAKVYFLDLGEEVLVL